MKTTHRVAWRGVDQVGGDGEIERHPVARRTCSTMLTQPAR